MTAYEKRMDDIESRMDERLNNIEKYLQEIRDAAAMGKGAWWLLLKIGGVMMALAGAAAWVMEKFK